ncbi:MAG: hypothetical protein RLZZ387_3387 [Chloroflexota bacterium]|jgi:hypothetical protein
MTFDSQSPDQRLPVGQEQPGTNGAAVLELLLATLGVDTLMLALPYTQLARFLGFSPLPPLFLVIPGGILVLYVLTAELTKRVFYQHMQGAAAHW